MTHAPATGPPAGQDQADEEPELHTPRQGFPASRSWRETTGKPTPCTARRRQPGTPHTEVTSDPGMRHEFPGEVVVYSGELPAVPGAASMARLQVREVLGSWHVPPEAAETAQLLLSEVVTNAVKFGGSGRADCADSVGLVLRLLADELVIEVSDSNQVPPTLAEPDSEAESGRGLWLVDRLSRKWGYHTGHRPGGKTVYCAVPA